MRLMHTKLPDFRRKMKEAAQNANGNTEFTESGLESFETAKCASLRVGRVEDHIQELTKNGDVKKVVVKFVPHNPEMYFECAIKAYKEDGTVEAKLENMYLSVPSIEYYLTDVDTIDDRRSGNFQ